MKISKPVFLLAGAGLGLTLVYSQQSSSDNSTKAQQILRQKIAELNNPASAPTSAPPGSLSPEARAKAQKILDEKLHQAANGQKTAVPAPNTEAQTKAEQALQQKLNELRPGTPSRPETTADAQQILRQKIAELNSAPQPAAVPPVNPKPVAVQPKPAAPKKAVPVQAKPAVVQVKPAPVVSQPPRLQTAEVKVAERIDTVPSTPAPTLTPELDAKAREVLRMKIAESRAQTPAQVEQTAPAAQAAAQAAPNQNEAELKAGVTRDTTEQTRILRLKIAESKGIITHEEAATSSTPVVSAARATPAVGALPVTFQSSNKVGLARLNELTELYKADRITPSEYHHERAKIVASL